MGPYARNRGNGFEPLAESPVPVLQCSILSLSLSLSLSLTRQCSARVTQTSKMATSTRSPLPVSAVFHVLSKNVFRLQNAALAGLGDMLRVWEEVNPEAMADRYGAAPARPGSGSHCYSKGAAIYQSVQRQATVSTPAEFSLTCNEHRG
jgi:hypothetical protein